MPAMSAEPELDRIRAEYARRERALDPAFYDLDRPANLFMRHGQERALAALLGPGGLKGQRLLDVGCGAGWWLSDLQRLGAPADRLAGLDLDPARVAEARQRVPAAELVAGDAAHLPWPDDRFDLVSQFTVFSSILDPGLQEAVAGEMRRVLRPGGRVIWCDFFVDNPRNRAVRGVGRRRLEALFPGFSLRLRRVTLAPPLARLIAPRAWPLARLIESTGLLNTHYMGLLEAPGP